MDGFQYYFYRVSYTLFRFVEEEKYKNNRKKKTNVFEYFYSESLFVIYPNTYAEHEIKVILYETK